MIRPESSLIASRPAISLPSAVEAIRIAAGLGLLGELLQRLGLGGDQVALDLGVVDDVDLLGAVLLDGLGHGVGLVGAADEDRGRLAEPLGDGQQLVGRLADRAVDVVDENQNSQHHICLSPSDELLGREELDQRLGARAVLVGDDLAGGARRAGLGALDRGPGAPTGRPRRRRRRGRPASRSPAASSWPP